MSGAGQPRWLWFPLLSALTTAFFVFRVATAGPAPLRVIGLALNAVWLALSIYDLATRGRVRHWLSGD